MELLEIPMRMQIAHCMMRCCSRIDSEKYYVCRELSIVYEYYTAYEIALRNSRERIIK